MINDKYRALKIAELLLQVKAVKLQPEEPFTWASGWKSPIYCDNRITLSHPAVRTHIRQSIAELIIEKFGKPELIVGVATGAIAIGALVAQEMGLPFVYVRSAAKGHGRKNLIEGHYEEGQKAVVIEDLISTGGSSLKAVESLRESGIEVKGLAAIFTYGFTESEKRFIEAECAYSTLTDYTTLLEKALDSKYIKKDHLDLLREWRRDPSKWLN
ncbi:MAG: orotate phosphoribosyltransferase [Cryomorphaceae bacterium]|nr:orotate phosphoribosyltransferase [Cryomorphaceae bacterium]|tara:strand:+ start:1046 stop:1687 length:642 start_codon:yes stop_codon:yes gene_type:complete